MRLELETNAGKAKRQFDVMAANLPAAIHAGVTAETITVYNMAKRKVGDIGKAPIPTRAQVAAGSKRPRKSAIGSGRRGSKAGNLAWERTGHLLNGLRMAVAGPIGVMKVVGPAAKYAHRRHQLGEPADGEFGEGWTPKHPALGIIRHNPFFRQAKEITEPQRGIKFVQAVRNKLGLRG